MYPHATSDLTLVPNKGIMLLFVLCNKVDVNVHKNQENVTLTCHVFITKCDCCIRAISWELLMEQKKWKIMVTRNKVIELLLTKMPIHLLLVNWVTSMNTPRLPSSSLVVTYIQKVCLWLSILNSIWKNLISFIFPKILQSSLSSSIENY